MTLGSIRLAAQILTLTLKLKSWELMRVARRPPDPDPDPERFRVRGTALPLETSKVKFTYSVKTLDFCTGGEAPLVVLREVSDAIIAEVRCLCRKVGIEFEAVGAPSSTSPPPTVREFSRTSIFQ